MLYFIYLFLYIRYNVFNDAVIISDICGQMTYGRKRRWPNFPGGTKDSHEKPVRIAGL
jgi:hypothetical protein